MEGLSRFAIDYIVSLPCDIKYGNVTITELRDTDQIFFTSRKYYERKYFVKEKIESGELVELMSGIVFDKRVIAAVR